MLWLGSAKQFTVTQSAGRLLMVERDPLKAIAEKYRMEGYEVAIHPNASDLPAFLANTPIDVLARRHNHLVAIKANEQPQGDVEQVEISADLGADSAALLVEEAELLLSPQTIRAALAMAWAAFRAAARAVLKSKNGAIAGYGPNKLIDEIRSMGFISDADYLNSARIFIFTKCHCAWCPPGRFLTQLGSLPAGDSKTAA